MARRKPKQEAPDEPEDEPIDPATGVIQAFLVFSLIACLGAIFMVVWELNNHYGVTFGGMMKPPEQHQTQGNQ